VSQEPTYQERLAVTGTVLGVTVEPYDRHGRQRAVDAILHYPDGRTAALEVPSTGPDDEAPIQHFLGDRGRPKTILGINGTEIGGTAPKVPPRQHAQSRKGTAPVRGARVQAPGRTRRIRLRRQTAIRTGRSRPPDGGDRSKAYFILLPTAKPPGGAIGLPCEVDTLLGTNRMPSKLAKLADSGQAERHG
jgi:hypothetical protein